MPKQQAQFQRVLYASWLILTVPALVILWRYGIDSISYGQVIHQSGNWSVGLLALALVVTPLRRVFPNRSWTMTLQRLRRAIGVASFAYAALHTAVYLERKWGYGYILDEAKDPGLLTGWIALVIFVALAATSNNPSVRRLRANWKRLHRLVYPAAALTFAHWILTALEPLLAWVCLSLLCAVLALRWWPALKDYLKQP